jgi:thiamine-phosphate pyrophosphorylase
MVAEAIRGGINLVQLREKSLPTREILDLALRLRQITADRVRFVINGRADVALAAGADGVHLPSDGMSVEAARQILGEDAVVGQSVHSVEEARHDGGGSADYVELGTIFPSRSHPGGSALGLDPIREAARFGTPVLAVGGITPENIASVIEAGAAGVAVISAILSAPDPRAAAEQLAAAAREAWELRSNSIAAELGAFTPTLTLPRRGGGDHGS